MSKSAIGIAVTDVSTTQQMPLGFIYVEPAESVGTYAGQGEKHWVYVFNDDPAVAFAVGSIVVRDPSTTTNNMYGGIIAPVTTAAPVHSVLGVAQHAIAVGSYGFILCKGQGLVVLGTNDMNADTQFTSGGQAVGSALMFADGALGNIVIGFSLEAETTNGATFDAYINCMGA